MNRPGRVGREFASTFMNLALLGLLALLPSCGGGGGGGDVAPDIPETNLDYVFGPPRGPVPRLTVTGPLSKFTLTPLEPTYMIGTYDKETLDVTITDNAAVPILWADTVTPSDQPLFGNLEVTVSQAFRWNGASDPTAGEVLITSRNGFFPGTIRARVLAGGAGVRSEYDSGNDGTYEESAENSWGSFYDLWEDGSEPVYERVSSFVYSTRETAFSLMEMSMETSNAIEDHRAELEAAGSDNAVQVECDALPGESPGSYTIVWTDVNGNGLIDSVGPQYDTLAFAIDHCWMDNPSDSEDLLLDGGIHLAYYEAKVQWGIVFNNLVVTPTLDNVVVPEAAMTVNGGFSLLIPGY